MTDDRHNLELKIYNDGVIRLTHWGKILYSYALDEIGIAYKLEYDENLKRADIPIPNFVLELRELAKILEREPE